MSDTWSDIQAVKNRTSSLRAKMAARRKEREGLVAEITNTGSSSSGNTGTPTSSSGANVISDSSKQSTTATAGKTSNVSSSDSTATTASVTSVTSPTETDVIKKADPEIEKRVLLVLCDISLDIPCNSAVIADNTSNMIGRKISLSLVEDLLRKFAAQHMISITPADATLQDKSKIIVSTLDISKLSAVTSDDKSKSVKRKRDDSEEKSSGEPLTKQSKSSSNKKEEDSIESLLSMQSAKEKETKQLNEEIQDLLTKQTAKEQFLVERFKSQGGAQLKEFCQYGTKEECKKISGTKHQCRKLHFRKIIHKHTDESLGDCSFLNTCFHMDTCKYVHYEIDYPAQTNVELLKREAGLAKKATEAVSSGDSQVCMFPPQWIQCDLRNLDMSTLGKCAVIMADPPWDIHMELPYGTMSDDEMRKLDVPSLQDHGFIFLWVTGRAMELGRECLELWGYKRVDELIWVKTNQLQRIIRTGRTGHWLNHGKEHCLVGVKGNPKGVNKGLDCDVIVAEVRATSHKPDEVYGIIERLSPGTRKVELFGRPHNVQPNWITLGNQVEGVRLKDPDIVKRFKARYPDGNCMEAPKPR